MSRYLFVVPPLIGHINPTLDVGAELTARGHEVAWVGYARVLDDLLPLGARTFRLHDDVSDAHLRAVHEHWLGLRGTAELKFFWEEFLVPLGDAMLPGVEDTIALFAPDVLVADQQALAGPVAAMRAGLPWATSATTSSEVARPLAAMPKVEEWVVAQMTDFQRAQGVSEPVDLRWSPELVLVFSSEALVGSLDAVPAHFVFTGPSIAPKPATGEFPWEWLDSGRRTVLASLGTLNAEAGRVFYSALVDALADEGDRMQVVIVAPPGVVENPPEHVLVRDFVPQRELLGHVDAVVTHGGHNTVCEALANRLPLVVAPIRDDQPVIAQQVADAGAGIRVSFGRVRAPQLRAAVLAVLDDPAYRGAAARIADSFAASGGAQTAANRLEELSAARFAGARQGDRRG
ncbi:glycosyltransferase [Antrihabitans sp. YC2-6]|uniref:glycosyltransferase n=1 Tax=Antrihabitans sp. YC2-6 TaxID=2799498 RepID=UPI0018F292EF|nr:nucleotide disphospho-sugar-binding domain-containing protein [Antrihabitans sp. YC2-6]MBJ8348320.1 glycosyltransferase [Antrihabitans sp. YC2-6]